MSLRDPPSSQPTVVEGLREPRQDASAFALAPGTLLGRYVLVDQLGAGGMATVYVAYDAQLARRVAIKVLRPGSRDPDAHARSIVHRDFKLDNVFLGTMGGWWSATSASRGR